MLLTNLLSVIPDNYFASGPSHFIFVQGSAFIDLAFGLMFQHLNGVLFKANSDVTQEKGQTNVRLGWTAAQRGMVIASYRYTMAQPQWNLQ